MNRQWRGIGSYLMFFAVICMVLMFFESQMQGKAMYTYEQYEQAIDNADITSATITPNQETPTGTVTYTLKDGSVKTTNILNTEDEEETLKAAVKKLFEDENCGNIFRIKGFLKADNDKWLELNATHSKITLQPIAEGQDVLIVIGERLNKEAVESYIQSDSFRM